MSLDLTGVTVPFSAGDLVTAAMAFVGIVGTFILLGLAIKFAPKIIAFIKNAIAG